MDKIKRILYTHTVALAVLDTLAEAPQGFPESHVYLALNSNYELSMQLIGMLTRHKAINLKGHYITQGENFDKVRENSKRSIETINKALTDAKGIK